MVVGHAKHYRKRNDKDISEMSMEEFNKFMNDVLDNAEVMEEVLV